MTKIKLNFFNTSFNLNPLPRLIIINDQSTFHRSRVWGWYLIIKFRYIGTSSPYILQRWYESSGEEQINIINHYTSKEHV